MLLAPAGLPALAQGEAASLDVLDVNVGRYDEDGRVTMVVEFRNIVGLNTDEIVVTENGVPLETIEVESIAESTVRVGIVLVIDVSGSMVGDPIEQAKAAAASFVRTKRDQDWIALVTFGDEVNVLSAFRNEQAELLRLINTLESGGDTALYDAVIRSVGMYQGEAAELQPHMIILTDGADDGSQATIDDVLAVLDSESAPRVFGIGLETTAFDPGPLQSFSSATDGLYLATSDPAELATLYDQIQRELDNKLVLRFNASTKSPEDVAFGVEYGALVASTSVAVPGFVTRTTAPPTTTTVTFPQAEQYTVISNAPAPPGTLLLIGSLAVGLSLVMLLYILFGREEDEGADSFRNRLQAYGRGGREAVEEKKGFLARIPLLGRFTEQAEEAARQRGILNALNNVLEQGNIPLRAGEAIAAGLGLSVIIGVIVWAVTRNVIFGTVALAVMLLILFAAIQRVGQREKTKFEEQLPDTLILVSTSLRAGLSLLQAVEAVVSEAPQPTAREFGRVIAETRLGRPVVDALHGITARMRSEDWNWAVMAIEIQREVGGNLAEVLQTVADTMLQRNRLRGEIRALTAEGRISAVILGAMPFLLFLFLFTTNPDYLSPLTADIRGWSAIGVGLLLMGLGGFWLKKIVDIEI
jgi:tight adherence protein B